MKIDKINMCVCGSAIDKLQVNGNSNLNRFFVCCRNCGRRAQQRKTFHGAFVAWNVLVETWKKVEKR